MAPKSPKRGATPLMRQYYRIKSKHPDRLLLFRMGDFYETFDEDALIASEVLGIVLSKRASGRAGKVPLAGFPHHALDNHLPKLIKAGLRVAICEQLEDPKKARQLVRRGVVEVVSPGVSLRENLLNPTQVNYLAALHWAKLPRRRQVVVGVAYVDVSTGQFLVTESTPQQLDHLIYDLVPREILVEKKHRSRLEALRFKDFVTTAQEDWVFTTDYAREVLLKHFGTHSLKGFGVESVQHGVVAAGAVLHYLGESHQGHLSHIRRITRRRHEGAMRLDPQTRANLSLIANTSQGRRDGPLFTLLDRTGTPMGARLLRRRLGAPLYDVKAVEDRLDAVEALVKDAHLRSTVKEMLAPMCDIERIVARICTGQASPRDLGALRQTLQILPSLKALLEEKGSGRLRKLGKSMDDCRSTCAKIVHALVDNPPASLRDGSAFRDGYHKELDRLRSLARSGRDVIATMRQAEIDRTGIPSLKVGFNKVFGYYIEVTNAHRNKVPDNYVRRQTLVNAERYVTRELKEYEEQIVGAEERLSELERELFMDLRSEVARDAARLQRTAAILADLDCHTALADVAADHDFCRPSVDDSVRLVIVDGRHPVVEQSVEAFIPNTIEMDAAAKQIFIITGPNMAGKSVVLRQTGLIVLLAQAGSFVPARSAHIGLTDRIFTRVGASDNLVAGESTFLVEMNETASIIHNASPRSLILLDEVGRGTSTFDGLSIAWALVEHLHETPRIAARTLFATHYHELNALAKRFPRIRNFSIQVREHEGRVIFLRKLVPGGTDHSYGLEVARMAGLPETVLKRAREILEQLERKPNEAVEKSSPHPQARSKPSGQTLFASDTSSRITEEVRSLDPNRMTPIQALVTLVRLKSMAQKQ